MQLSCLNDDGKLVWAQGSRDAADFHPIISRCSSLSVVSFTSVRGYRRLHLFISRFFVHVGISFSSFVSFFAVAMSRLEHLASYASRREGDENYDPTAEQGSSERVSRKRTPCEHDGGPQPILHKRTEDPKDQPDPEYRLEYEWRKSGSFKENTDFSVKRVKKKRRVFGLEPHRRIKQHHKGSENLRWSCIRATFQEPFSEFLGVLVFTMIQQGGIAQATLSAGYPTAPGGNGYGQYLTAPFW